MVRSEGVQRGFLFDMMRRVIPCRQHSHRHACSEPGLYLEEELVSVAEHCADTQILHPLAGTSSTTPLAALAIPRHGKPKFPTREK